MIKVKVKDLHYIKDAGYSQYVKDLFLMAETYPERTETHEQLDRLNYSINHQLVETDKALSVVTYEDSEASVIVELDMFEDGRVYAVQEFITEGIVKYALLRELGVKRD